MVKTADQVPARAPAATPAQQARQHALGDVPRRTAQRVPDKLALVDGKTRLSFAELDAAVDRAAASIAAAGLVKGDRLALLSHNCWQFVVLDFAAARVGVVLVPVNFMLGGDEVAFMLDHSEASAFVVEDALVPVADAALAAAQHRIDVRRVLLLTGAPPPRTRPGAGPTRRSGSTHRARRPRSWCSTTTRCG